MTDLPRGVWPTAPGDSRSLGSYAATNLPVLDLHELAAGKLAALFGRQASRDVFDAWELLRRGGGSTDESRTELEAWTQRLVEECRDLLGAVLPLEEDKIAFLTRRPGLPTDGQGHQTSR